LAMDDRAIGMSSRPIENPNGNLDDQGLGRYCHCITNCASRASCGVRGPLLVMRGMRCRYECYLTGLGGEPSAAMAMAIA
jgi:hypothetical protein